MVLPPMMPPQAPLPQAFGPPPPGVQPGNPMALLASLKALVGTPLKAPEPLYRPGYKPPKKPEPDVVVAQGKKLHANARLWRHMIYTTLMWADQRLTGMFPEDQADREAGFQEEWVSPMLSAERNLVIATTAAHKLAFKAPSVRDELKGWARRKEEAARWLREEEAYKHVVRGNATLEYDEARLFTDYGMYVSRDTLNPRDAVCPVKSVLIDPSQVHPIYRKDGLDRVYRVYRATPDEIAENYGDFSDRIWKKITADQADIIGVETELDVTEYWDTWYRLVMVGDTVVIEAAHEYGDVPWTVQYGNHGNPMFTRTATDVARRVRGSWDPQSTNWGTDRVSKAVPYLYYHLKSHELYEAIAARIITSMKKDINPPTIRYRSNEAAEKPMEQLDASPGAQNEAMLNEEKIEAMPTVTGQTASMAMQMVQQDMQAIMAPPQMRGALGGTSNVTGVAQAESVDAGLHLIAPLRDAYQSAMSQKYDRILRMLGNFGHMATYGNGEKTPVMVPSKQGGAYEFDREIMEKVGTRVAVTLTNVNPRTWAPLAAAGESAVNAGFLMRKDVREVMTGETDFDAFYEEWAEEQAMFMATTNPDFQKLNMLAMIEEQIAENEGRPQIQASLQKMAGIWQEMLQPPPQAPPPQPGMGGAPQPPQPGALGPNQPQGPMQGPYPSPPGGISPGGPGGISYPQMGAGPGSGGQPVGRPY
jgi:hypothetical protein